MPNCNNSDYTQPCVRLELLNTDLLIETTYHLDNHGEVLNPVETYHKAPDSSFQTITRAEHLVNLAVSLGITRPTEYVPLQLVGPFVTEAYRHGDRSVTSVYTDGPIY